MAIAITENKYVMGRPQYRFEVQCPTMGVEYFEQGWQMAVKAYQWYRQGHQGILCREWKDEWLTEKFSKKANAIVNITDDSIAEGKARAERSRQTNGKEPRAFEEVVPTLSDGSIAIIQNAVTTLKLVAQAGKKQLPDEETRQMVGMELMQVLNAMGYTVKDIKHLVNQYDQSIKLNEAVI